MGTGQGHVMTYVLLVDLGTGHRHLGIRQEDGYLVALSLDILVGKLAEIDVGFQRGIHRDGDLALPKWNLDVVVLP